MTFQVRHYCKGYPVIFYGGYRLVRKSTLEHIINLTCKRELKAVDLRLWCKEIECTHHDGTVSEFPYVPWKAHVRVPMGIKPIDCNSYPRLYRAGLWRADKPPLVAEKDYMIKLPRKPLRYLAMYGNRVDFLVFFLGCLRAMTKQRYSFRFNQTLFAQKLGVSRKALCVSIRKLYEDGVLYEIRSLLPAIRKYGKKYGWVCFAWRPFVRTRARKWSKKKIRDQGQKVTIRLLIR